MYIHNKVYNILDKDRGLYLLHISSVYIACSKKIEKIEIKKENPLIKGISIPTQPFMISSVCISLIYTDDINPGRIRCLHVNRVSELHSFTLLLLLIVRTKFSEFSIDLRYR